MQLIIHHGVGTNAQGGFVLAEFQHIIAGVMGIEGGQSFLSKVILLFLRIRLEYVDLTESIRIDHRFRHTAIGVGRRVIRLHHVLTKEVADVDNDHIHGDGSGRGRDGCHVLHVVMKGMADVVVGGTLSGIPRPGIDGSPSKSCPGR